MSGMSERNRRIAERVSKGEKSSGVAEDFGISRQRVYQIVKAAKRTPVREDFPCDDCGAVVRRRWRDVPHRFSAYEIGRGDSLRTCFVFCGEGCRERFVRTQSLPPVPLVKRQHGPPHARALGGA